MATRALQQVVCYYAWNTSTNAYVTGDAANHSTSWVKDGTRSATTNATAEVDATNTPGLYKVTMTATETDCIEGVLAGKSSTANVVLIGTMAAFDYLNTSAPATAGIPDVNAKNINNVSTSSVTTINANQGTTQPLNFTGTGGSALVKGDAIDINSVSAAAVTTIGANLGATQPLNFTGTGASALVKSDVIDIAGTASAGTAGSVSIDWAQVKNPTSTVGLTNTTISTTQIIASVSGAVGSVTGAVGSVTGAVGSVTGNVGGNVTGSVGSVVGAVGSVTGAVGSVTGNVGGNVNGNVVGSVASVTAGVTVTTNNDKTGYALSSAANNAAADALLDRADAIETGITPRLSFRYSAAALAGQLSGAATTTVTILGINSGSTRVTATVDANGNRSAVSLS